MDVGGTFTDICIFDDRSGEMRVEKVPSSDDPIEAVLEGVKKGGVDLRDVALFSHGTTVATNALITRRLPRAAMVATRGFRDIIEIRRGTKEDLWDAYKDVAPPYIRRRDRLEVTERVDYAGKVLTEVERGRGSPRGRRLRRKGIETIAVCFINAYANPANEQPDAPDLGRGATQGAGVVLERGAGGNLRARAFLHYSGQCDPGAASQRLCQPLRSAAQRQWLWRRPAYPALRRRRDDPENGRQIGCTFRRVGIAAGAIAGRHIAKLAGFSNAIGLDMGGTSTDISLWPMASCAPPKSGSSNTAIPICLPSIEVLTIGARWRINSVAG